MMLIADFGCGIGKPLFEMCCLHMGQFVQGGKNGRLMSYFF